MLCVYVACMCSVYIVCDVLSVLHIQNCQLRAVGKLLFTHKLSQSVDAVTHCPLLSVKTLITGTDSAAGLALALHVADSRHRIWSYELRDRCKP